MPINFPPDPNSAPEAVHQSFTPYSSPPLLTPRVIHEPHACPCDQCVWMRLSRRIGATPPLEFNTEHATAETMHSERPQIIVSPSPNPQLGPNIYVYPNSSHHLTLPVVNYTAKQRAERTVPWPACSMAIYPPCAQPADFEAALSPPGSGFITVARLSKTKKTAPLSTFKDVEDLRKQSIQLEVWDQGVSTVHTRVHFSPDIEAGSKGKK
ncbi:uncharacterized protein F4807DRAFT_456001 [Annulohypoxylon truncatum]|uniref:uncharacterized protein n=1 Tax=Annulohypoxylon truncatum TaxID=327061 RepID=UPI0020081125|nr:uncharacterized protein F4807DRAFT_456001 [Annulohypoxylon truncatum]KAI1214361.1 hypothetical protein F4807DRAFT_456001 [Annulohypoxylon truncatum]